MATGQVLFQRFYYSKSFVKHNMEVSLFVFWEAFIVRREDAVAVHVVLRWLTLLQNYKSFICSLMLNVLQVTIVN